MNRRAAPGGIKGAESREPGELGDESFAVLPAGRSPLVSPGGGRRAYERAEVWFRRMPG